MLLSVLILILGCGPREYTSIDECESISAGPEADECWAKFVTDVFRTDAEAGIDIVNNRISDQRVRDFVWLKVTREVDPGSYQYCEKIEESALEERCRVLVSRPHLHRELLKGQEGKVGTKVGRGPGPAGPGGPQGGGPGGPGPGDIGGPHGGPGGPQGGPGGPHMKPGEAAAEPSDPAEPSVEQAAPTDASAAEASPEETATQN